MTEWVQQAVWPPPPRTVPWRSVRDRGFGLAIVGVALVVAGAVWLIASGGNAAAIAGAPSAGPDTTGVHAVGWLILPGLLCVGWWFRIAWRAHVLLTRGRIVPAQVGYQQRALFAPGVVGVGYRFRTADGAEHEGRCRIAMRSPEGESLWRGARDLFVAYDPERPRFHVLAAAGRLREL